MEIPPCWPEWRQQTLNGLTGIWSTIYSNAVWRIECWSSANTLLFYLEKQIPLALADGSPDWCWQFVAKQRCERNDQTEAIRLLDEFKTRLPAYEIVALL